MTVPQKSSTGGVTVGSWPAGYSVYSYPSAELLLSRDAPLRFLCGRFVSPYDISTDPSGQSCVPLICEPNPLTEVKSNVASCVANEIYIPPNILTDLPENVKRDKCNARTGRGIYGLGTTRRDRRHSEYDNLQTKRRRSKIDMRELRPSCVTFMSAAPQCHA